MCITLSYEMTGDSHTMASTAGREEGTGGGEMNTIKNRLA